MARKKSSRKKALPSKEFSSSPFKDLKGLSAFKDQAASPNSADTQKSSVVGKPLVHEIEGGSFADEMDFLGVKPLPGKNIEKPPLRRDKSLQEPALAKACREENDKDLFLDSLGAMERTFVDGWPEDEPRKQAVPRRMKQVERGQLKPEAELDLHGLTVEEARAKVRFFLQDALYQGFKTTLIITGKGLHSSTTPVLRQAVERLLETQRELVLEWGLAPQRYGGSGALVVFLRQPGC